MVSVVAKYDPLREALQSGGDATRTMSFEAVAGLVGGLPASANEHQPWCVVVGEGGLEPPHPFGHRNLNPARLPIPPLAHGARAGARTGA
jgi:hypothetical protein